MDHRHLWRDRVASSVAERHVLAAELADSRGMGFGPFLLGGYRCGDRHRRNWILLKEEIVIKEFFQFGRRHTTAGETCRGTCFDGWLGASREGLDRRSFANFPVGSGHTTVRSDDPRYHQNWNDRQDKGSNIETHGGGGCYLGKEKSAQHVHTRDDETAQRIIVPI